MRRGEDAAPYHLIAHEPLAAVAADNQLSLLALDGSEDLWIENGEHGEPMTVCAKDADGMYIASCDVTIFL